MRQDYASPDRRKLTIPSAWLVTKAAELPWTEPVGIVRAVTDKRKPEPRLFYPAQSGSDDEALPLRHRCMRPKSA